VWQRAMDFVTEMYRVSADFPKAEQFGLTSQIRRAAISIPLNIAEGAGSASSAEFQRFLSYALRSTYEVMAALEVTQRLGYCIPEGTQTLLAEADEIAAMLVGLSRSLNCRKLSDY
jgi:four helix bundle protein